MTLHNKPLAALAAALLGCTAAMAGPNYLVVTAHDGSVTKIALAESPKITGDAATVVVTSGSNAQYEFSRAQVRTITMQEQDDPTGVTPTMADERQGGSMRQTAGTLHFTNLRPQSQVAVVALSGAVWATGTVGANGSLQLTTAGLPAGIYVVKNESITYKIIIKQ